MEVADDRNFDQVACVLDLLLEYLRIVVVEFLDEIICPRSQRLGIHETLDFLLFVDSYPLVVVAFVKEESTEIGGVHEVIDDGGEDVIGNVPVNEVVASLRLVSSDFVDVRPTNNIKHPNK